MSGVDWALVAAIEDAINEAIDLRAMLDADTAEYRSVDQAVGCLWEALQIAKANAKATR